MPVVSPETLHQLDPDVISERLYFVGSVMLAATTTCTILVARAVGRLRIDDGAPLPDTETEIPEQDAIAENT